MKTTPGTVTLAIGLSLVAWFLLFAHPYPRLAWAGHIPIWLSVALALAAAVLFRRERARPAFLVTALLIVLAGGALWEEGRNPGRMEASWRARETRRIVRIFAEVGERVRGLENLSRSISGRTSAFWLAQRPRVVDDPLGTRIEAFRVLGEQADQIARGHDLPEGTQIGIQLFDENGTRVAWAGWPQALDTEVQRFITRGDETIYPRRVSLYRILTHVAPIRDAEGEHRATVVVDMPLEVNFRVNNKFLKSTSLAADIASGVAATVRFEYAPAPRVGKMEVVAGLPDFVELLGPIDGEPASGLSGRARILSTLGQPLFNVTVTGRPLRTFAETQSGRLKLVAHLLLLAALLSLFRVSLQRFPARWRGPTNAARALYLILFVVFVRYWLLVLHPSTSASPPKLFNPAIFATPILGGLMRSSGDLLLTAALLVIALYGVLKITRSPAPPDRRQISGSGSRRWTAGFLLQGAFAAAVLLGACFLTGRFVSNVVANANPRLVGETMRLFEINTLVLHLSVFLMIAGIFLAGMIAIWGVYRLGTSGDAVRASLFAAALIVAVAAFFWRWEFGVISLLPLLFVVFAPRVVQREDLVSIVIVAFCFVIIVSSAAYTFLNEEYQNLRRTFIQEKVAEITHPSDNWKVFILEDVLENFSRDNAIRTAFQDPARHRNKRLAFDLWAGSSLSLLGYSSAIHVFDGQDSLVSRFTVEMPYRMRIEDTAQRIETPSSQEWIVLDLTTDTPQGSVRFYRGIVNIIDYVPAPGGGAMKAAIAKVVVDIPFFFENLSWAARTGPQTPEVLRNVQEGAVEPRLEEPEALLLARIRGGRVFESSSDILPVGFSFDEDAFDKARNRAWPLLDTRGAAYRVFVEETDVPGTFLLAGFPVPRPLQHVLRWSTILSLYFFFVVAIIILLILLKSLPPLRALLPTLTPGRRLGFQQKLLASFLGIALVPAILLGIFSVGIIKERFVQENRKEALDKSYSASKSLANLMVGELHYLLDHIDLRDLTLGGIPRYFGNDPHRLVRVFTKAEMGADVDAVLEPVTDSTAVGDEFGRLWERFSSEQVFVHRVMGRPYVGLFCHPIVIMSEGKKHEYMVYYGRLLGETLLGQIADQVGADVNLYDGGELVASSRAGLLSGGFISAMMNADAFVKVSLMGVDRSLVKEQAGRYRYEVAYLPIQSAGFDENAALGLPLLFRPESYHVEVQKTTSIVLSIFGLLSAATIGLGLLLARGIFEPLKGLVEGTRRISRGDLAFKLPSRQQDEIGTVMASFNEMTTQLARSQAALDERRRYLEVILENIGTGVISGDADGRIRAVNNAAERILGIKDTAVMEKTGDELVAAGVVPEFFALLAGESPRETAFISSEVDIFMAGQRRTIKYMRTRLSTEDQYMGAVCVFEDLTELINTKKLSAWVEMARQIAHEIKNPLTPIKLSAQFMVRAHEQEAEDFDKIFKEGSETIIQQVEVLRRIASEFSSFGRLQQLKLASHDVARLVQGIVAPYRRNDAGVEIAVDCPDGAVTARIDPEAFRKICTNLIENALEAMSGGGKLDIQCAPVVEGGCEQVCVAFRDTGPGLNEDVKQKLFEPYFSTKTTGTGLGLAICRTLSREMGGDVVIRNLKSAPGVEAKLFLVPA